MHGGENTGFKKEMRICLKHSQGSYVTGAEKLRLANKTVRSLVYILQDEGGAGVALPTKRV